MRSSRPARLAVVVLALSASAPAWLAREARAQQANFDAPIDRTAPPALTGVAASAAEGPMEGVLVTARATGSTIAASVVTDGSGRFAFPRERLPSGDYALSVRATGYRLAAAATARVAAGTTAAASLELAAVADISSQLTNTEWIMSVPGTDSQKRALATCASCHSLERVVKSTHTAGEWVGALRRMVDYAAESGSDDIPRRPKPRDIPDAKFQNLAAYLATINRSRGDWAWPLRTLPRPRGAATRVVVTEYFLPRAVIGPHDVSRDDDGFVWYSNSAEQTLGRVDPRDGAVKEFSYPTPKPDAPLGSLDLEPDASGGLWLSMMYQGGLARFDKKTETFKLFPVPPELATDDTQQSMVMPAFSNVDGKVWTNEVSRQSIMRVDAATGKYELIDPFANAPPGPAHTPYGLAADAGNNLWFMDFGGESIGRVDAKTLRATFYPTPTRNSHPRRVMYDGSKLWFAEFAADRLGSFDIAREKFEEWRVPTPWSFPYDAFKDRAGFLWSGNMSNDRILRLDTATGASVEYLLPRPSNIRRVFVDNTTRPPALWAGNNHGAEIVRMEALE